MLLPSGVRFAEGDLRFVLYIYPSLVFEWKIIEENNMGWRNTEKEPID